MADFNSRVLDCDDCEGERGERGKRGKRGHRGHAGHNGHDGDSGSTGPTGPTGPAGFTGFTGPTGAASSNLTHVEASRTFLTPLPPSTLTPVLTLPPIVVPVGSVAQISAMINYENSGNTTGNTTIGAGVYQDGVAQGGAVLNPGREVGPGVFNLRAVLPVIWVIPGDGAAHVYSLQVQTDAADGVAVAGFGAMFVNVVGP